MDQIENIPLKLFLSFCKIIKKEFKNKGPESKNEETEFIKELEDKIKNIEKLKGWEYLDSTFIDLSLTGLTMMGSIKDHPKTFKDTLDPNLTSLGVAVTHQSVITLPDCKDKLKKLKSLRMEGSLSGIKNLGEKLGKFTKLNDLTLANMDIGKIPDLPKLLCLRLYGVCQGETCKIELEGRCKLKKLVIGDMRTVKEVQISSAVLKRAVTLKFSNLPMLKEVYTDNQNLLLKWRTSTLQMNFKEVQPNTTIFLRDFKDFRVKNNPGLDIYHYDE